MNCEQPLIFLFNHSTRAEARAKFLLLYSINLECLILLFHSPRVALRKEGRPLAVQWTNSHLLKSSCYFPHNCTSSIEFDRIV